MTDDSAPSPTELWTSIVRMETKLDLVIGQHNAKIDDHEVRLRSIEGQPGVTPKGMATALSVTVAILVGLAQLLHMLPLG